MNLKDEDAVSAVALVVDTGEDSQEDNGADSVELDRRRRLAQGEDPTGAGRGPPAAGTTATSRRTTDSEPE